MLGEILGEVWIFHEEMLKSAFSIGRLSDLTSTDVEGKADFPVAGLKGRRCPATAARFLIGLIQVVRLGW